MKKKTRSVQYALRWRLVGNRWQLVGNGWQLEGNRLGVTCGHKKDQKKKEAKHSLGGNMQT